MNDKRQSEEELKIEHVIEENTEVNSQKFFDKRLLFLPRTYSRCV